MQTHLSCCAKDVRRKAGAAGELGLRLGMGFGLPGTGCETHRQAGRQARTLHFAFQFILLLCSLLLCHSLLLLLFFLLLLLLLLMLSRLAVLYRKILH